MCWGPELPAAGAGQLSADRPPNAGDMHALLWGLGVLILIVVATDQLIWRPLIAWSDKFKFEQVESAERVTSPILTLLQRLERADALPGRAWDAMEERIYRRLARHGRRGGAADRRGEKERGQAAADYSGRCWRLWAYCGRRRRRSC